MKSSEIRQRFLDFFKHRGHAVVASSPLVPANDPTLLFTNAGMVQFKEVFLGLEKRPYARAVSSQRCVRAGGKHNDLENVGYTARHHTFFEMLGNFSFGDYFKRDGIKYAWEFLIQELKLPPERLWVTVYRDDDEAADIWLKEIKVDPKRFARLGEASNFWQMGDTGPCGPCSEIFYDHGPQIPGGPPGSPDEEGDRYVEIWNLVFMQYNRDAQGNLTPLPKPSVDTGMGLERIAAVQQGVHSNYRIDLFQNLIRAAVAVTGATERQSHSLNVVADHIRAAAFLITDGVIPSNEGRGYVLRKIMRRALRHARLAGRDKPFLYELTGFVAEHMKAGYPEMMESVQRVARVVKEEETRYQHSFALAERMFETETENISNGVLPGSAAFKLYDSFGLSLDEQEEMARERKLTIDPAGLEKEMNEQRSRARASWKGGEQAAINPVYQELREKQPTKFEGYGNIEMSGSTIVALLVDNEQVETVPANTKAKLILNRTPFYAESGGQVGDQGVLLSGGDVVARVGDVQAPIRGLSVHSIVTVAPLKVGQQVEGRVDGGLRRATMRNHTATHLMHAALRKILGTHVKQAGSVVAPDRLRFDVTHYTAVDQAEREEVERLVNEEILKNTPVTTEILDLDEALKTGAMALFGEKYTEKVRVVGIDGFSKELCGGTHVSRTGDIGVFKITSESSVAAGVRRLEAITGLGAYDEYRHATGTIARLAATLRVSEPLLVESVEKLAAERKSLEREVEQLKGKLAESSSGDLIANARDISGIKVISAKLDGLDRNQMRSLVDSLRNKLGSGVVVLASTSDGNIALISAVTKDLAGKRVHAGKLVGAIAQEVGGRGGGRPDLAEAGGTNTGKLPDALEKVYGFVAEMAGD